MINKKIIHFDSKSKFEEKKSEISETSIVFVKDSNEIYTHGEEYQWVGWSYLTVDVPEGYTLFYTTEGSLKDKNNEYFVIKEDNEFL